MSRLPVRSENYAKAHGYKRLAGPYHPRTEAGMLQRAVHQLAAGAIRFCLTQHTIGEGGVTLWRE